MSPYRARASAKMRMRIIPTKSLGCCALALHSAQLPQCMDACGNSFYSHAVSQAPVTQSTAQVIALP